MKNCWGIFFIQPIVGKCEKLLRYKDSKRFSLKFCTFWFKVRISLKQNLHWNALGNTIFVFEYFFECTCGESAGNTVPGLVTGLTGWFWLCCDTDTLQLHHTLIKLALTVHTHRRPRDGEKITKSLTHTHTLRGSSVAGCKGFSV